MPSCKMFDFYHAYRINSIKRLWSVTFMQGGVCYILKSSKSITTKILVIKSIKVNIFSDSTFFFLLFSILCLYFRKGSALNEKNLSF